MSAENKASGSGLKILLAFLPLVVFLGLAAIFYKQLASGGSSSDIPSALIGKQAPKVELAALEGLKVNEADVPSFSQNDFTNKISIVNVFASWCAPCRAEHPQIMKLAQDRRIQVIGLNYKDSSANALSFLNQLGNPYDFVGVDPNGRASIDWGVYGVPETFIVGRAGTIEFKHVGPISEQTLVEKIQPMIEKIISR